MSIVTFGALAFLAGIITAAAPCILPLLPILVTSGADGNRSNRRVWTIVVSLIVSVFVFTLALRSVFGVIVDPKIIAGISGVIITLLGVTFLWPNLWSRLAFVQSFNNSSNRLMGKAEGVQRASFRDVLVGLALGPVFSSCSPTYLFILATVLPANHGVGIILLVLYCLGLGLALLGVAYFGSRAVKVLTPLSKDNTKAKKIIGTVLVVVGLLIISGLDKKAESWLIENEWYLGGGFERGLLENLQRSSVQPVEDDESGVSIGAQSDVVNIPVIKGSRQNMPISDAVDNITIIESGKFFPLPVPVSSSSDTLSLDSIEQGCGARDCIPALTNPNFESVSEADSWLKADDIIFALDIEGDKRAYPQNILNWHEIINDTVGGQPVAVTFCPLCGSAISFDRVLDDGQILEFGVSGYLHESNLLMYSRGENETFWQQATGKGVIGPLSTTLLTPIAMSVATWQEWREAHPDTLVLSRDTGYRRDYVNYPYGTYESDEQIIFPFSGAEDSRLGLKDIVYGFELDVPVAVSKEAFDRQSRYTFTSSAFEYELSKADDGTVTARDNEGTIYVPIRSFFVSWVSFNPDTQVIE